MEVWKDVVDFEGYYQVSSEGRVRKIDGTLIKVTLTKNPKKYPVVRLTKDRVRFTPAVHRLVAKAFLPNPDNRLEVNHINAIKEDNRACNLEWCTRMENVTHANKMKLINYAKKLTASDVKIIRELATDKTITTSSIAKKFNIAVGSCSNIIHRKVWVDVE